MALKPKILPTETKVEDCNIGTKDRTKIVKISKSSSPEEKWKYIYIMKEYMMSLHGAMNT